MLIFTNLRNCYLSFYLSLNGIVSTRERERDTRLPLSIDSSSMNRISGVSRSFIRRPSSLRTYFALDLSPAMATSFPLSSPNIDTYTFTTCSSHQRNRTRDKYNDREGNKETRESKTWRSPETSTSEIVVREER